jgi:hypothetical protein
VQKLFKTKGVKAIIGEEIQKDFFDVSPQKSELDNTTRNILVELQKQLGDIKNDLIKVLN